MKVLSVLTIQRPNYTDSGKYKCVATIMNGRDGNKFRTQETADLTILGKKEHHIALLCQINYWVYFILLQCRIKVSCEDSDNQLERDPAVGETAESHQSLPSHSHSLLHTSCQP